MPRRPGRSTARAGVGPQPGEGSAVAAEHDRVQLVRPEDSDGRIGGRAERLLGLVLPAPGEPAAATGRLLAPRPCTSRLPTFEAASTGSGPGEHPGRVAAEADEQHAHGRGRQWRARRVFRRVARRADSAPGVSGGNVNLTLRHGAVGGGEGDCLLRRVRPSGRRRDAARTTRRQPPKRCGATSIPRGAVLVPRCRCHDRRLPLGSCRSSSSRAASQVTGVWTRPASGPSGPSSTATPAARSVSTCPAKAGWLAWAALRWGRAATGSRSPIASVIRPRASVSLMPSAHLAIVLEVAGVTSMASAGGSTSGSPGSLYWLLTGCPVSFSSRADPAAPASARRSACRRRRRPSRAREP